MRFRGSKDFAQGASRVLGVLLTNVGTPAAPTARAVRPYLAQFLGDGRVIEYPRWAWLPLLHGVILNVRSRRSARLYAKVWTEEGSPLLAILRKQGAALEARLAAASEVPVCVAVGMRYGEPSIASGLRELAAAGARRIVIFPLYGQYSATTTATALDAAFDELKSWRWMPEVRTIGDYHDDEGYLAALEESVREHWAAHGRGERLLMSYHGVPKRYVRNGDPYYGQCLKTSRLLAERLGLAEGEWAASFQSRFGPEEWLTPYTDETLEEWGRGKLAGVDVICPGFSADCLETVDEIGREGKESFIEAGGGRYHYIPALNDRANHMDALAAIVLRNAQGWLDPADYALEDEAQAEAVSSQ